MNDITTKEELDDLERQDREGPPEAGDWILPTDTVRGLIAAVRKLHRIHESSSEVDCPDCGGSGGYRPAYVAGGEIVGPDACRTCDGHGRIRQSPGLEDWCRKMLTSVVECGFPVCDNTVTRAIAALLADRDRLAMRVADLEAESRLAAKTPTESEWREIAAESEVPPEEKWINVSYRELWCAVWCCPIEEYEEGQHAETVKEAERQAMALAERELGKPPISALESAINELRKATVWITWCEAGCGQQYSVSYQHPAMTHCPCGALLFSKAYSNTAKSEAQHERD